MISLQDVFFEYPSGGFSFHVPRLTVAPGQKAAVIGPSGAGKTTLLNLISGIEAPRSGQIRTAGVRVDALSTTARRSFRIERIGFVFQELMLLDYLDVLNNIVYPYRLQPSLSLDAETLARARQLAKRLGIERLLSRRPDELSQGERQRVAIARALVTMPSLLLADEPTGSLDPDTKSQALDLLFEQCDALSMTLLMVTHDHGMLERFDQVTDVATFSTAGP